MSDLTKIYLVTNCFGDPNKVYIGKTKLNRKNKHQRTYGKDIIYTYIDEINSLKKEDWEPLETFWIEYFRQLGFDLQNKRMKGGGGPEFCSEETKLLKSKIAKGKPKPLGFGKKLTESKLNNPNLSDSYKRKVIDINTNIIYDSCTEAAKANNVCPAIISNSLNKIYKRSKWNFEYYGRK